MGASVCQVLRWKNFSKGGKPSPKVFETLESSIAVMHGISASKIKQTGKAEDYKMTYSNIKQDVPKGKSASKTGMVSVEFHNGDSATPNLVVLVNRETMKTVHTSGSAITLLEKAGFKVTSKFHFQGTQYTLGDFVLRLCRIFYQSAFSALVLEVEYTPVSQIDMAQAPIDAFIALLNAALPADTSGNLQKVNVDASKLGANPNLRSYLALQYASLLQHAH